MKFLLILKLLYPETRLYSCDYISRPNYVSILLYLSLLTANIPSRYSQIASFSCECRSIGRKAAYASAREMFKTMSSWCGVRWKHANHLRWGILAYSLSHEQTMARPITRQSDPPFDLSDRSLSSRYLIKSPPRAIERRESRWTLASERASEFADKRRGGV